MQHSPYYDPNAITREVTANRHREAIGGLWEEMGRLQLEFLKAEGLAPQHHLLDIGCGALRFGVRAVDYLQSQHYYGQDISAELMQAGYENELSAAQQAKLPTHHLAASHDFNFQHCDAPIDYAIAQSLFTHLPFNHLRFCLANLRDVLAPKGRFYATFFLCEQAEWHLALSHPAAQGCEAITTSPIADPYHYSAEDMHYAAAELGYSVEIIGNWNHPRGQQMVLFRRA